MKRMKRRADKIRDTHITEYPTVVNDVGDIIYILDNDGREVTLEEFLEDQRNNTKEED